MSTLLVAFVLLSGTHGPGPETFTPTGRFVFRNEAEAIARRVAATRSLEQPVNVVEVRVESTSMTPGGRGWSIVVVGKVPGGCHAVSVGIAADDGRVYAIEDRHAQPSKPPADCEKWYVDGGAAEAKATIETAAVRATPAPTPEAPASKAKDGARALTREDVARIATEQATKKGYTAIEPKLLEFRPGADGAPGAWRADVIGSTEKGCGIYKLELREPDWKMRYQNNQMAGRNVALEECRAWYDADGKLDSELEWLPGYVEWDTVTSDNLQ